MVCRCAMILSVRSLPFSRLGQKAIVASALILLMTAVESLATQPRLKWTQTPATSEMSCTFGVTMDSAGNLYTVGRSDGTVFGVPSTGTNQGYVAKYSPTGALLWSNQWSNGGLLFGIATDANGSVLIANGSVTKFSASGDRLWQAVANQSSNAIAVDAAGNSFIAGSGGTYGNPCVSKVSPSGAVLWTTPLTSLLPGSGYDIAVDGQGNSVITGHSNLSNGTQYGFAAMLNSAGSLLWNKQYGAQGNYCNVASAGVDSSGGVYLTGGGMLLPGSTGSNALVKYDYSGNQQWSKDIGPDGRANSIAVDPMGGEYVCTGTGKITKFSASGAIVDEFTISQSGFELAYGNGTFGIANSRNVSGTMSSYVSCYLAPEPSTLAFVGIGAISLFAYAWRRRQV